jgi:hypothetical protein
MLPHQRRRIVGPGMQGGNNGWVVAQFALRRIAEPDRNIAQPALMSDAANRAAFEPLVEILLAPSKQLDQRNAVEAIAHIKVVQRRALREFVPRADYLAIVASQHPVADQGPQIQRNAALQFDREIGNAAPRIEPLRAEDGLGWADGNAGGALAAMRAGWRIHRQRQVGVDLAEEEHRAGFAGEQQRMFSAPAQS